MCALHSEQGGVCHQGQLVPGPRHGHTSALVNKLLTSDRDFFKYVNWWNMHLVDSMHCYCLKVIWGNSGSAFMLSCCLDLSQKCKSKIIFAFALYSIMLCGVMVSELGLVMVRSVATLLSWACIQVHCILTFTLSKALRLQHIQVLSLDDLFVFLWCISE